jgi:integrase
MARAKAQTTKYPGVFKRETTKLGKVYDFQYRDSSGRQVWVRGKHRNLEQANDARVRALYETAHGIVPSHGRKADQPTFDSYADEWLDSQRASITQGRLRSSTVAQREHDLRRHLRPHFGSTRLVQIDARTIDSFQNALSASGLSNWTVRRLITTLGTILEAARRHKLIAENPAKDVRKPAARREREPIQLTPAMVMNLADAATRADERNLILVAAWTGLRASEVFGLRWSSVDLTEGEETLIVSEQFYEGELVDRPKTPSGHRQIVLHPIAAQALRSQQIEGRSSDFGIVFPAPEGSYWRASNFNRRQWSRIRARAGLQELHLHDLRHFYTSFIRGLGLAPALTEQLIGHSDERTHRSYTYAIPGTESMIRAHFAAADTDGASVGSRSTS